MDKPGCETTGRRGTGDGSLLTTYGYLSLWLSIAALSLITLPNEFLRVVRGNELNLELGQHYWEDVESRIGDDIRYLKHWTDDSEEYDAALQWYGEARFAAENGVPALREGIALLDEGDGYSALTKLRQAQANFDSFISSHSDNMPQFPSPYDASEVMQQFQHNSDHAAELERLFLESEVGGFEALLQFLSPYLLGIALGLRLAKVSAKVLVTPV